ncbi:DUF1833 family protein [Elioraea sp.]|uniref:DUF1833 family protein n=1 Tax=Elioraea sp. TaxID=2185103 RepID=UPI0025BAE4D2|nr:DUF1833 family protein [Elioraea sp.]
MTRALSLAARQSLTAEETGEAWLILLTIEAEDLASPIRVVNDGQGITSRGNLFVAYPFEIDLPGDDADSVPRVTLKIDNVHRDIVAALRALTSPPSVAIEVVRASEPDLVEAGPFRMTLRQGSYDTLTVEGELVFEDVLNARYPADAYVPADYPGLF